MSSRPSRLISSIATLAVLFIVACEKQVEHRCPEYGLRPQVAKPQEHRLAVYPLHNPARLIATYQRLADFLNAHLKNARITIELSRDYGTFERKYAERKTEFILPNAWQTLQAIPHGYHVLVVADDPKDCKGIFVVRKDSGITRPIDLKGKAVSYPASTSFAACIMPQYFLHRHGINVNRDIDNRYVGSQESSIMNTYLGQTAAGATWPPPWRAFQREHPQEASALRVAWETESLVNRSVMARDDVPYALRDQITKLLVDLNKSADGKQILFGMETARFIAATDRDYDAVRKYVASFEKEVRKIGTQ